jgi:hypothetical protein
VVDVGSAGFGGSAVVAGTIADTVGVEAIPSPAGSAGFDGSADVTEIAVSFGEAAICGNFLCVKFIVLGIVSVGAGPGAVMVSGRSVVRSVFPFAVRASPLIAVIGVETAADP